MKVLITGADGQLGYELQRTCPSELHVQCTNSNTLDISNPIVVANYINEYKPNVVINAAAYTNVDKAESERDAAFKVNAEGVKYLAQSCHALDCRLIHVSTDFVFDGTSSVAYEIHDMPSPVNVYGESKLRGENYIEDIYKNSINSNYTIIRTSWVYSTHGNNFVKTMLRLMRERESLKVVTDQIGAPTWANNLARVCWCAALNKELTGIYHYSDKLTDGKGISWFEFASEIYKLAHKLNILDKKIKIKPIETSAYPTPALRPKYSVINTSATNEAIDFELPNWLESLSIMLNEIRNS